MSQRKHNYIIYQEYNDKDRSGDYNLGRDNKAIIQMCVDVYYM